MTKVQTTIKQIIDSSGGKICSVIFIKKSNGKIRHMVFKKSDAEQKKVENIIVKEMKRGKKDYWKTIKLDSIISLKVNGVTYNFGDR